MLVLLSIATTVFVADTVRYEIAFPDRQHHEAEVMVTFPAAGHDTLDVRMSRSSPGRYALHEFAKNVYAVTATDGAGRPVAIHRPDPYRWLVTGHDGTVVFRYTLFADRADGTYSQFDAWHAHMNMPATFAWAAGLEAEPIAIRFATPAGSGWRVATQLAPTADPQRFLAPDMAYFMDSPTLLSAFSLRQWTVASAGRVDTIRLAMQQRGTDAELDGYLAKAKAVVAEEVAIFGETARYDHGTYTFIANYTPQASGDGMEHRNSTVLSSNGSLARNEMQLLSTLGHEFFHSWNVERIRPAALEPFDFFRANPSDALWFAEGFTSYYTPLPIRRAGLMTDAEYAASIGGTINAVVNAPGRRFFSPLEMSLQAPFVDAATSVDPTNRNNTFLSYYTWGAGIGLGMDLAIRGRFPGKSLDGLMRLMWTRHGAGGRYAVPRPYTVDDLERALADYTGDAGFAREFFASYIRGREAPDYATLLAPAGFILRERNPGGGTLGEVALVFEDDGAVVQGSVTAGTPLYLAGLDGSDRVTMVSGTAVTSAAVWRGVMAGLKPGDTVRIAFTQRGEERVATVTAVVDPALEVVPLEATGQSPSAAERSFRQGWLGSRAAH